MTAHPISPWHKLNFFCSTCKPLACEYILENTKEIDDKRSAFNALILLDNNRSSILKQALSELEKKIEGGSASFRYEAIYSCILSVARYIEEGGKYEILFTPKIVEERYEESRWVEDTHTYYSEFVQGKYEGSNYYDTVVQEGKFEIKRSED